MALVGTHTTPPEEIVMELQSLDHQSGDGSGEFQPLGKIALYLLTLSFVASNFIVALDGSILSTAIPTITSQFNSLNEISWYGTAYLFTQMACGPAFGKIFTYFNAKSTYLASVFVFEVGSIVCASAPNSVSLIIGRAIAGIGASGIQCGCLAIYAQLVPLHKRPLGIALITCVYGIADVLGPTLGGVITDSRLTWRFCFWINLPFGFVTAVISIMVIKLPKNEPENLPLPQKLRMLDLPGAVAMILALISLSLSLQRIASTGTSSDYRTWIWFSTFVVCAGGFIAWQIRIKDDSTIPPRIISQRTICVSCVFTALVSSGIYVHVYYLPIFFQATKGMTAAQSGVNSLSYVVSITVFIVISGFIMTKSGLYVPLMWIGSIFIVVGAVLIYTIDKNTTAGRYNGFQVIAGVGFGLAFQVSFVAVQVVVSAKDLPVAVALVVFFRSLGGAIGLDLAQLIFSRELVHQLRSIPDINSSAIIAMGAGEIAQKVNPQVLGLVRECYERTISKVFILSIAVAGLALISSGFMERKRIPVAADS